MQYTNILLNKKYFYYFFVFCIKGISQAWTLAAFGVGLERGLQICVSGDASEDACYIEVLREPQQPACCNRTFF